jgi:hypothetical protein
VGIGEQKMIVGKKQNQTVHNKQALVQSLKELSRCFEKHCRLVSTDTGMNSGGPVEIDSCGDDCPCRHEFKTTLIDTIQILEGTRKNFKSKQIEALRRKLTETLVKI